jgi:ATP-dependent RNA helicase RhlE
LFSATFPEEVQALAQSLLRDARAHRRAGQLSKTPRRALTQRAIVVDARQAHRSCCKHLIEQRPGWSRVLVFVATQYATRSRRRKALQSRHQRHRRCTAELSQGSRAQVLKEFKRWTRGTCWSTTDLAARGIDIAELPAVVNYDLPRSADDYTASHRPHRPCRR